MKRLVILGAGESGVGTAILGKDRGYDVFVSDMGQIAPKYKEILDKEAIAYEEGQHTREKILDADLVVKSPGIAKETPIMQAVASKNIPVESEIEFAGRFTDSKMVCITGSNGKTTTTMLTYHILTEAGLDVGLAGNVGNSLAYQVAREPHPVYVIELSSFQLDDMHRFKADIAVLLNITPDHLDRYENKFENYVRAKFRILQNMTSRDAFIYWQDDPVISAQMKRLTVEASLYPFAEHDEVPEGEPRPRAFVKDGEIVVDTPATSLNMDRADLSLNGLHNLYNSLAAALSACLLDIPAEKVRHALSNFEGVEHRLEYTATIDGVRYINDSKATNVNSTFYALESMTAPTVLILGGKDKGNDYSEILPLVKKKVKAIVAMGLHNEKIVDFFSEHVPVTSTDSLDKCLAEARRLAATGDVVLLSPCCASFDLFKSYEDRGRRFKAAVKAMTPGEEGDK